MSKFDRGVFIFIGLGIWALAMTQIFKSEILQAGYTAKTDMIWFSLISGKCLIGFSLKYVHHVGEIERAHLI